MDSNDNEKMNIQIALDELDISLDEIELTKLDQEYIKKYGTKEIACNRRIHLVASLGYCKKYKIIDETFFK